MKKIHLLIGTLLTTVALSHAVDSYSDVVGYSKASFSAGTTGQSVGFVKAAVFTGSASKLSNIQNSPSLPPPATRHQNPRSRSHSRAFPISYLLTPISNNELLRAAGQQ